jgi:hypothetical protein
VVIDAPDHPSTEHAFDTTGYDELAMSNAARGADNAVQQGATAKNEVDVVEEADAVQAEVEAAAEPSSDDEVEEVAEQAASEADHYN